MNNNIPATLVHYQVEKIATKILCNAKIKQLNSFQLIKRKLKNQGTNILSSKKAMLYAENKTKKKMIYKIAIIIHLALSGTQINLKIANSSPLELARLRNECRNPKLVES